MTKSTGIKITSIFLLVISFFFYLSATSKAETRENKFDPDNIISDSEMLDYDAMNLDEIQKFLEGHESFLAGYTCKNAYGEQKTAAEIIYDASYNNFDCGDAVLGDKISMAEMEFKCDEATTINPQVLLVLLQKEMSLIKDDDPKQSQLDWATGYGCPDGEECNSRWKGFGKQVNSAALQFKDYMKNPDHYSFQVDETYELKNSYSDKGTTTIVTPENKATAALYNYTPHAYDGNYNFYGLWRDYFAREYPDGSLLRAEGEPGVWLIEDGKKRPIHSMSALKSRFDPEKIIEVNKSDLSEYKKGVPIQLPNYSIIRAPDSSLYLLVDDTKRPFDSYDAFKKIGFNPEEIIVTNWQTVRSYNTGKSITTTSTHPTGALLQNRENGGVYWVYAGKKHPLVHPIFLNTKFKNERIIRVSSEELAQYEKDDPVKFDSGELLTTPNSPAVYLTSGEKKKAFTSGKKFEDMGYKWENIITVPERVIDLYKTGVPLTD